ncbi:unnamed protein product [Schistosoma mattheei]|uniref:Uncharacterized protein n=1 Tax=Schistosoma mattheei TaxID=31246 RepID=A0A183NN65_9TREM|nr:unnamed protein product [Schistosoma mattheei]
MQDLTEMHFCRGWSKTLNHGVTPLDTFQLGTPLEGSYLSCIRNMPQINYFTPWGVKVRRHRLNCDVKSDPPVVPGCHIGCNRLPSVLHHQRDVINQKTPPEKAINIKQGSKGSIY